MGAERVRGDTDGGDTAGRDRAHRALSPDREPPGGASDGQGSDNPDGEGSVTLDKPFTNVERDPSIKAWEVSVCIDGSDCDLFQIFFYDDGHTELKRWTAEGFINDTAEAIGEAIKEAAPRLA